MNLTPEYVELIVQRVLAHLGTAGTLAHQSAPAAYERPGHCVQVTERVVTQALLAAAVNGTNIVQIGPKAILTPSARDFIRSRRIEIIRETPPSKKATSAHWQVLVTATTPQIAPLVEALKQSGIACDLRLLGLPAEAAAQAITALCRGEADKIVVFTNQPELVACLANRNDRVHAAAVADAKTAERVWRDMNANLLAIDPAGKGVKELHTCLKAFEK